ncbi:hypothetical protein BG011_002500 [Mortierella polycephala]|uniref:Uncharacterized protein n=1 Tax=Mortierella polycephala TaxID=41804 RepID=A0A9P6Q566_9FUNG|nr:hypothetical protein BG011_002500 [Mortierella polycephala]
MNLTSGLRVLRSFIILLTLIGFGSNIYEFKSPTHYLDHFNNILSFYFLTGYLFSLFHIYSNDNVRIRRGTRTFRYIGPYCRALFMILPALFWYSTNMTRPIDMSDGDYIQWDQLLSFPIAILIVVESVLSLKWEARRKTLIELAKAYQGQGQQIQGYRQGQRQEYGNGCGRGQETMAMVVVDNDGRVVIPTILPPEEQDNIEIVVPPRVHDPHAVSHSVSAKVSTVDPTFAQLSMHESSSSSSSSSSASASTSASNQSRHAQNMHTRDDLPPYSRT